MPQPQFRPLFDNRIPYPPLFPEVHVAAADPRGADMDQTFGWGDGRDGDGAGVEVVGGGGEDGDVFAEGGGGGGGHGFGISVLFGGLGFMWDWRREVYKVM